MFSINYAALFVCVILAFLISIVWYMLLAKQRAKLSSATRNMKRPSLGKMLIEIVRTFVLALVIAFFIDRLEITSFLHALNLGILLWIGFPLILLSGSVLWENVSWKLAAIHAGDWLIKILLITIILSVWR